ncbi:hypothetical protein ACIG0C_20905 [Kitasatospora aureofaciens]|uniref:Uncharacterized protein n=1 Tax=Kitasatospora aureofaciens TaxID=1894 RepID=A0A1E7N2D3_KITAU|nr:hypothetical protein [Kitasatospora aureofaciens]ARF81803.1 hypothetical protein B6264_25490 [Kitasatospora aureofaciens]OEV34836.1 hypothetical protein HS99_0010235 [Kitasatospora aureofaciens]GGU92873.1 hypothetical protein GCM10010502_53030 [Kitasatospora aureofaciens]
MVTYDELANTNLSALDTVATDVEQLVRRWEYESDFQSGVVTPLAASGWSGPASQAAAGQLNQARTQIDAAFEETSALAKALRSAHDQFVSFQNTLRQIQTDAQTQGLTISADGSQVTWSIPANLPRNAGIRQEYQQSMDEAAKAISARLTSVLQQATEADQAAAAALAADTGTNQQSFNATPVGGISEQEAAQAAALAAQGNNLSNTQLTQLNALLKAHGNDPSFATAFYNDLGPQETLKFWGQLSVLSSRAQPPDPARLAILKDLQGQLGTALASATNTRNQPHLSDQWETQLRAAGAQRIQVVSSGPLSLQPYGYQFLASILQTGNYDPHFLDPIAEHVTQLTRQNPEMWLQAGPQPMSNGVLKTNFLGNGTGFNPMTGVLEALGHSPAAATDFFRNPETLYNASGAPTGHTAPNDYLSFLTDGSKNPILTDTSITDPNYKATLTYEPTALGHALQAATTGVPWDAPNGTQLPPHTAATDDVMNQVVNTFGKDPSLLQGPLSSMNGSVANMTASYIGDVNQAVNAPVGNQLSVFGTPANLNADNANHLLDTLARDPGAYGTLQQAQNGYLAAQLETQVHQPGQTPDQLGANLNRVAAQTGTVSGILSNARANAVSQAGWAADAAYNQSITTNTGIANTIYSQTLGSVVGKVPILGDIANDQVSNMITNIGAQYQHDSTQTSVTANIALVDQGHKAVGQAVQQALGNAGLDPNGSSALNAATQAQQAYNSGLAVDSSYHQAGK